ncbi:MAG: hypothetical protein ACOYT8_03760 [Candidatus Dependentiae bacterium]
MNPKLIVNFDKTIVERFNYLPVIWGMSFFWILFVNQWDFLGKFIQCFFVLFDLLVVVAATYTYFLIKNPEPAAIIDASGIWVKHYGHIPWDNIARISNYQWSSSSPFVQLGITLKDMELVRKQASIAGKMGIFWSKIFNYPPILISNIELPNQTVIDFAQQFLEKEKNDHAN